jgi:hypothetical protein
LDAANVGQHTRLCEQVVDSIASADQDKSGDDWQLKKGSLQTAAMKSTFIQVIHEAAAQGQLLGQLNPVMIVTDDEEKQEPRPQEQPQTTPYQESRIRTRRASLVDGFVEASKRRKAKSWSADTSILDKLDELASSIHSPLSTSTTSTTPSQALPSPIVPRFRKRYSGMTRQKLKECLA